jgi:hypothetical protein
MKIHLKQSLMKKSIIIISLMCFTPGVTLNAQDSGTSAEEGTFGIKAGLNHSNVWDERGQDFQANPKYGLAGGIFFGIPIGNRLGFQPEILISQKGFQGSGTLMGSPYSFSRTTTYLDIPLQLQVKPSDFFTIVAGPQYSYLLYQKDIYTWGLNSSAQEEEFDNENIRKNTLGFVLGADINFSNAVISGRVGWDFQTNHGDGTYSTPRYKNQWLQLTLGFKI